MKKQITYIAIVLVLFILLSAIRVRLSKAAYHAEQLDYWLNHFTGKILNMRNILDLRADDVEKIQQEMRRLRTEVRYIDLSIAHHDEHLAATSGITQLREIEDNEFARLWLSLGLFADKLEQNPPTDLQKRGQDAAEELYEIIADMQSILNNPRGRALFIVKTLSPQQRDEFNALVREAFKVLLDCGDVEPGDIPL